MREHEQYQQSALTFDQSGRTPGPRETPRQPSPQPRSAGSRLPDELWQEYRFECENRARLDLPDVGLTEFTDMRDWSDGLLQSENVVWPPVPDRPPYERTTTE